MLKLLFFAVRVMGSAINKICHIAHVLGGISRPRQRGNAILESSGPVLR